jgi:hypothetical protein
MELLIMADIVNSLFGIDTGAVNREAMAAESNRAYQFANLNPQQQGQYGMMLAGQMGGRAVSGLLGAEDPRLVQARQMEQVKQHIAQQGLDINTPEGLAQAAQYAQSIGATEGAMYLGQQALAKRKSTVEVNKAEDEFNRETKFREAVAALPPEQRTEETIMQLAAQYGTTATVMSAMANLTRSRENIQARQDLAQAKLDAKTEAAKEKQIASNKSMLANMPEIFQTLDEADDLVGMNTTGYASYLSNLPLTDARQLKNNIKTLQARLSFDQIAEMRRNSPTGGALGSVSNKELDLLGSAVSALDQASTSAQLKAGIAKVRKHYENWRNTLLEAVGEAPIPNKYGNENQPTQPQQKQVIKLD